MQTLTGNEDTDVKIINSLKLKDLRQICQLNNYAANLCENHIVLKNRIKNVKKIVNRILILVNERISGMVLTMNNEYQTFKVFNDLMIGFGFEAMTKKIHQVS